MDTEAFARAMDAAFRKANADAAVAVDARKRQCRVILRDTAGAGVAPHDVNDLVKQFDGMADIMKQMSGMGMKGRMQAVQELTKSGALNPGAKLAKQKKGTGKRLSAEERAKQKRLRDKEVRRRKREARKK